MKWSVDKNFQQISGQSKGMRERMTDKIERGKPQSGRAGKGAQMTM